MRVRWSWGKRWGGVGVGGVQEGWGNCGVKCGGPLSSFCGCSQCFKVVHFVHIMGAARLAWFRSGILASAAGKVEATKFN